MSVLTRLNRLERIQNSNYYDVQKLIAAGTYYDELTAEQKEEYEKYKCSLGGVADDIAAAKLDVLFNEVSEREAFHFKLSERKPAVTREELQESIDEIKQYIEEMKEQDNEKFTNADN